jgi:uncharacterized protein
MAIRIKHSFLNASARRQFLLAQGALGLSFPLQALAQTGTGLVPGTLLNPPGGTVAPVVEQVTPREQRELLGTGAPRVALLLPPRNGDYVRISQALRAGFVAAQQRDGRQIACEILDVPDRNSDFLDVYTELRSRNIQVVVGPLTRNGVNAVIDSSAPAITTLALNQPDSDRRAPAHMLSFTLAIEGETRQLARLSYDEAAERFPNRRPLRALAIQGPGTLQKRAAQSFTEQWRDLGGEAQSPLEIDPRAPNIRVALAGTGAAAVDVVVFCVAPELVRALRAQVPKNTAAFATSLSHPANANPPLKNSDLEGLRFTEMPMMVQADHPAVMAYPKPPRGFTVELQRLYGLGVDAFRIAAELLSSSNQFEIDGITGRIRVDRNERNVERASVLAESRNGQLLLAQVR